MKKRKPSLRSAINAYCKFCIYDEKGGRGNWREQVTACTSPECPLYAVRPVTSGAGAARPRSRVLAPENGLLASAPE